MSLVLLAELRPWRSNLSNSYKLALSPQTILSSPLLKGYRCPPSYRNLQPTRARLPADALHRRQLTRLKRRLIPRAATLTPAHSRFLVAVRLPEQVLAFKPLPWMFAP